MLRFFFCLILWGKKLTRSDGFLLTNWLTNLFREQNIKFLMLIRILKSSGSLTIFPETRNLLNNFPFTKIAFKKIFNRYFELLVEIWELDIFQSTKRNKPT